VWVGIVSLFPEMFHTLEYGVTGRALKEELMTLTFWNPRDYASDSYKTVDDKPYGGGPGMLMKADPLRAAIHAAKAASPSPASVIYLSPQGRRFDQETAEELAAKSSVIFIAGRYEGIDERIIEQEVDEEWSLGDFILTGGELAAMAMLDAAARLIPGTVGDAESVKQDSLTTGLLKYPQYTRPEILNGAQVPKVLLSGNHKEINTWRLKASLGKTWLRRPDLMAKRALTEEELALLTEFIKDFS
jgi:tRNA (guanine37-N1)-methyltransferase